MFHHCTAPHNRPALRWLRRCAWALAACGLALQAACAAPAPIAAATCPPEPLPEAQARAYIEQAPARNAGFLWRADKDGRSSWLYGTLHTNTIELAKPGPQVMARLRASDVLAVEIDLLQPQTVEAQALQLAFAPTPPSARDTERLRQAHARECQSWDARNLLQQTGTTLVLAQAQRSGLHAGYGADARLMQIAQRTGKPIVALESLTQQVKALLPATQSELDVRTQEALNDYESGQLQQGAQALHAAWQRGDWPTLLAVEAATQREHPALAHRLLDARNALMAQKIDALHAGGQRVFVAVGALHMAGSASLPALLQARGYSVTPIDLPRSP